MGTFLSRGKQGFEGAVNSRIYVDKTDMLHFLNSRVNTEQRYICVSRPRRFGKSMTANMIAAYYDRSCDARDLFVGRKLGGLAGWNRYLNAFNVIRIDFAEIRSNIGSMGNQGDVTDYVLKELYADLSEEYHAEIPEMEAGPASWLHKVYEKTGTQFVIIIDEWDAVFRDERANQKEQERYIDLLRGILKGDRAKDFLALVYITGILPIKKYNSESALNNFYEYTMLEPAQLAPYIGFTQDEVKKLCDEYHMDYETALEWYDGYHVGKEHHVCGPNSIVRAMDSGKFANYWSRTVAFESLKGYITMNFDGLKDAIVMMLGGQRVRVKTRHYQNDMTSFQTKDDVLTLLIHLGYLAYDEEQGEAYLPNKEVREYFEDTIEFTGWDEVIRTIERSEHLLQATLAMDADAVAAEIDICHANNTRVLKYHDENSLVCCITLAYYAARKDYHIVREMPAGYGFADMVFVPKRNANKPALVVELKWKQDVQTAISQIKDKQYGKALADYAGEVLLVGISYQKTGPDAKKHFCVIERTFI